MPRTPEMQVFTSAVPIHSCCLLVKVTEAADNMFLLLQVFAFSEAKEEEEEKDEVIYESSALDETVKPQPKKKV